MKLKYVLFSGLLLSVGFTACTNEDFTEAISPVSTDGIALDEVTLNVGNGADTKAALGSDYKPTWEEGDLLGAARFHKIPNGGYDNDKKEVTNAGIAGAFDAFNGNYTLELTDGAGTNDGTFTTQNSTGLEAGAHVLYYPQYKDVTPVGKENLPVEIQSYDIDCADPMWNLNENMFAYSAVKFVPDQKTIDDYTLRQVPVLYNLYFEASEHLTQNLDGPITIKHIVVEAWNGTGSVVTEYGQIVPVGTNIQSAADYNNNDLNKYIKYQDVPDTEENGENVDHLFYNVKNSASNDYQLITKGVKTVKGFKFMALPWSDEADLVIIKAVTDKGTFTKTYKAGDKNEAGTEYLKKFNEEATAEGGQISLNVILDTTEEDEVIYTAEQMKDVMANIEAGETYHWIMGEPITVDADLNVAEEAKIYISRYPLTVNALNATDGGLYILNDLTVKGDVTIDDDSKGFETVNTTISIPRGDGSKNATGEGILTVGGKLTIGGGTGGDVYVKLAKAGDIEVTNSGIATLEGRDKSGDIKETEIGNIDNGGELTLKNIVIAEGKTLTIDKRTSTNHIPTLILGDDAVENNGTIINNGVFDFDSKEFNNNGIFNLNLSEANVVANPGLFKNNKNAELNIANTNETSAMETYFNIENAEEAEINIDGKDATKIATFMATQSGREIENNGVINVNAFGKLQNTNYITNDGIINVAKDGEFITNDDISGYVVVNKDAVLSGAGLSSGTFVVADITKKEDVDAIHSSVNTFFVNCALTVDATMAGKLNTKNLVLYKDLTLANDLTMLPSKVVRIAGKIKINSNDPTVSRNFKLDHANNEVLAGASLTLGKNVTLSGTSGSRLILTGALEPGEGKVDSSLELVDL